MYIKKHGAPSRNRIPFKRVSQHKFLERFAVKLGERVRVNIISISFIFNRAIVVVMPVIPILPSINTCMSLTTTTSTVTNATTIKVPEVNTTQLQALAEVCSSVTGL